MKIVYPLFFLAILTFLATPLKAQKDFRSGEWLTLEGREHLQNTQDYSGTVKLHSTGEKIIIETDIVDDNVIINDNYLLSDRIELWLSSDRNPAENIYTVRKDSITKFNPGYRFYNTNSHDKNSVKITFGTVHYAILPSKEKKVHLLNRENYDWVEKCTGEKPGHIEQGISVKTELTKTGYKLTISLSPLALGFIQLPAMNEIKFKLHAVDFDNDKLSSVVSVTGKQDEFQNVQLGKALFTNVTSISSYIFDSLGYHPTLMFNSKGFWSGVTKAQISIIPGESNTKTAFIRSPVGSRKWKENNIEIEKISLNSFHFLKKDTSMELLGKSEEFYFSKNSELNSFHPIPNEEWLFKGLQKEFSFQDYHPGLLLIQIDSDSICQNSSLKTLIISKLKQEKSIELLKIIENPRKKHVSIGSLVIQDFKIEKIHWQKEGVALLVEGRVIAKGEMKFRIGFQGDKAIVTPIKK